MPDSDFVFCNNNRGLVLIPESLAAGHFIPYFQPIVVLATGELVGLEILARWQGPALEIVLPDCFIPHAERFGWIDRLTEVLLRKAVPSVCDLPGRVSLSVNISPIQFHNAKLVELFQEIAGETGLDLHLLVIELTETTMIDDPAAASRIANRLRQLGCRISLDDFGMGYSGMFHLDCLPFDELKIDRSFVNTLVESWESRKVVATFVELARSRGLRVVAEGIETFEQAEMLLALGCRFGQGWLYGRPAPPADLPSLILASESRCAEHAVSIRSGNATVQETTG